MAQSVADRDPNHLKAAYLDIDNAEMLEA